MHNKFSFSYILILPGLPGQLLLLTETLLKKETRLGIHFGVGGSAQVLLALTIDFWTLDLGLKTMYEIMRVLWEFLKGYTFIPSY